MVDTAQVNSTCLRLLRQWAGWFKDGHIQLSTSAGKPEEIRKRFANWETIEMTEADVKSYFDIAATDPLEGIWEAQEGNYRCGLLRMENKRRTYAGFILQGDSVWWMPGQVKFELGRQAADGSYSVNYFMRNHTLRKTRATLKNNVLNFDELSPWRQVFPAKGPEFIVPEQQPMYTLKKLDQNTLVLTLPTMNANFRKELKALVKKNRSLLKTHSNLVIDCRNNGGGSDITYFPLRPYLYTKPLIFYHNQTYSTKDNNQKYYGLANDKNYPFYLRIAFKKRAKKLDLNLGKYIGKSGIYKKKLSKKYPSPQKIAVLINGGCASSCEQFVLFANQSDKVTLMGQNTAGIKDYGNLHMLEFPNEKFRLHYPTTRRSSVDFGKGIDNIGITPHVKLDSETEDWVSFAKDYLNGNR